MTEWDARVYNRISACTQRVDVEATTGKTTKLSLRTSDALGARDSDSLRFKCERAAD